MEDGGESVLRLTEESVFFISKKGKPFGSESILFYSFWFLSSKHEEEQDSDSENLEELSP